MISFCAILYYISLQAHPDASVQKRDLILINLKVEILKHDFLCAKYLDTDFLPRNRLSTVLF